MILRPVTMADWQFIYESYQDWPLTNQGPITQDTVVRWIRYWLHRDGETCLIAEEGGPVGLVVYRRNWFVMTIKNLVVHPTHRGNGHSNVIAKTLFDKVAEEGVVVAEFDAMPGPIAEKVGEVFEFVEERQGETGVLRSGRVTQETEL